MENCGPIRFDNDETVHIIYFQAFSGVKDKTKSGEAKEIPNWNLNFMFI